MAKKNPIEARLDLLHDQWTEFAQNPEPRLLRWLCKPDEVGMVDTFVAAESDPQACNTPDLFLRFDDPFLHEEAHGYVLRESFIKAYEEARPALEKEGLPADFVAPHAQSGDDDVHALLRTLNAYHVHQGGQVVLLACYLTPAGVRDLRAYQLWLQRLIHASPAHLRFALVDTLDAPRFAELATTEPTLTVSTPADLSMSKAAEQISSEAGGLDTPGGRFRQLFVMLGSAAKELDLVQALPLALAATNLAKDQGWFHLAGIIQIMLASIHAGTGDQLSALRCYTEAEQDGIRVYEHGESGAAPPSGATEVEGDTAKMYGLRLRRDARFGQGASLIATGAWGTAAKVYLDAAPIAHALGDARGEFDAFRLAATCFARDDKPHEAWHSGMKGFEVAGRMDEETRKSSTLPYLGQDMLRLTSHADYAPYRPSIERSLEQMLGKDFRTHGVGSAA